jgi:hypothetical protein
MKNMIPKDEQMRWHEPMEIVVHTLTMLSE